MPKLVLVAVGGNALIKDAQRETALEQFQNADRTARAIVALLQEGHRVVVSHGNGPQVGAMLIRSDAAAGEVYRLPYDCCVAATQGEIGYVLQYSLWQLLQKAGLHTPVVSLVTQVLVDKADPAFAHPTKPVGPFYQPSQASHFREHLGWEMVEVPGRGLRRLVPSPQPKAIVEIEAIRACVDKGLVVIAGGGGGVPVANDHDITKGVEAVIDKDMTSAILAQQLGVDVFAIATDEPKVFLDYGKPGQRALDRLSLADARRHLAEGQFPEGSMGPKIRAAIAFLEAGGRDAVVTDAESLVEAVDGRAGTHVVAG